MGWFSGVPLPATATYPAYRCPTPPRTYLPPPPGHLAGGRPAALLPSTPRGRLYLLGIIPLVGAWDVYAMPSGLFLAVPAFLVISLYGWAGLRIACSTAHLPHLHTHPWYARGWARAEPGFTARHLPAFWRPSATQSSPMPPFASASTSILQAPPTTLHLYLVYLCILYPSSFTFSISTFIKPLRQHNVPQYGS